MKWDQVSDLITSKYISVIPPYAQFENIGRNAEEYSEFGEDLPIEASFEYKRTPSIFHFKRMHVLGTRQYPSQNVTIVNGN